MRKIQRILKVAWQSIAADKRAKKAVVYLWATTLLYYVIGMWYPIALSNTIDGFEGLINGTKAISSGLIFGMIGLLSVAFYHSQYYMIQSYNYDIASSRIETGVRGFILRKTVEIRYDELCLPKNQDRIQILRQEYPRVCSDYLAGSVLMTLVGTFVSFVFLSVVLLRVYPWIALIVILSNIFSFLKTILEAKLNYYHVVGNMRERRWADAYAKPMYDRKSIKEIRLFGVGAYFIEKWKHFTKLVNRRTLRLNTEFTLLDIAVNVLCYGSATLALLLTCMMIRNGRASTGAVLLVYAAVTSLMDRSGQLFYACRTIFMSTSYEEMYRSFQNMQSTDGGTATDTETQQFDFEEISFNNVSFTYPGSQNPALSHFSFSIRRGEKVAIVGENGSGKSTMVSLLCGL